jgi:hypothetical protein
MAKQLHIGKDEEYDKVIGMCRSGGIRHKQHKSMLGRCKMIETYLGKLPLIQSLINFHVRSALYNDETLDKESTSCTDIMQ